MVVDEADRRETPRLSNDVLNGEERGVVEFFQLPQPLVQRKFECGNREQLGTNQQTLVRGTSVRVPNQKPVSESIPENEIIGGGHRLGGGHVHTLRTAEIVPTQDRHFCAQIRARERACALSAGHELTDL